MTRKSTVAVIGGPGEPTAALIADLQRLGYRPDLIAWPAPESRLTAGGQVRWPAPPPLATLLDLRVVTLDAARACRAVREQRALKAAPLLALVPEHEAPRLDLSLGFDDLVLAPYRLTELAAHRIRARPRRPPPRPPHPRRGHLRGAP